MTIEWSDGPPTTSLGDRLQLLRCPPGSGPPLVVLSSSLVGVKLHWIAGRSTPHVSENCKGCEDHLPTRWRGYLACWSPKSQATCILELTEACVDAIANYRQLYGTLRGAQIRLSRPSCKANGRIHCEIIAGTTPDSLLPVEPDIKPALIRMWDAPTRRDRIVDATPRNTGDAKTFEKPEKAKHQKPYSPYGMPS